MVLCVSVVAVWISLNSINDEPCDANVSVYAFPILTLVVLLPEPHLCPTIKSPLISAFPITFRFLLISTLLTVNIPLISAFFITFKFLLISTFPLISVFPITFRFLLISILLVVKFPLLSKFNNSVVVVVITCAGTVLNSLVFISVVINELLLLYENMLSF